MDENTHDSHVLLLVTILVVVITLVAPLILGALVERGQL